MPASTAFDALARLGVDDEGLSKAGHYTLIFGLVGAAGAAATGVLDYYEIKNRPVRRVALYHGLTNTALVGSYVVGGFAAGPLARTSEESWDRMMDLNLKSAFLATRAALEHLPDGGRIVNVGTAAETNKAPGLAAYVASKGGLRTLTQSLAKELKARRITANAVLPTVLDTPAGRCGTRTAPPGFFRRRWRR